MTPTGPNHTISTRKPSPESTYKEILTMSQMLKVDCKHGAPMGRSSSGDAPKGRVRLYWVKLDSGGYDDGGAYWGLGDRLYCAEGESADGNGYRRFTRASDRNQAAGKLGLLDSQLAKPVTPKEIRAEILYGLAKGPWACWWADRAEEKGRSFSGQDTYQECPEPPKGARDWARKVAAQIELVNGKGLPSLYQMAKKCGYPNSLESFGADLGLQVEGTGISWEDRLTGVERLWVLKIEIPYAEFYL
jgi:hypothetical protein